MAKYIQETTDEKSGLISFTIHEVEPANGHDFTLEELQQYVGGLIELVGIPDEPGKIMVVNEEFLFNGSNPNPIATAMIARPDAPAMICGSALICDDEQVR